MACEFPVTVKAKLMLTAIHCLLTYLHCDLRNSIFMEHRLMLNPDIYVRRLCL